MLYCMVQSECTIICKSWNEPSVQILCSGSEGVSHTERLKALITFLGFRMLVCRTIYWGSSPLSCSHTQCTSPELTDQVQVWEITAGSSSLSRLWWGRSAPDLWGKRSEARQSGQKKGAFSITTLQEIFQNISDDTKSVKRYETLPSAIFISVLTQIVGEENW